jgi:AcrR family transcriptional regulator
MPAGRHGTRVRAPDATRGKLLGAAMQEIHRHGFQGAGLDTILARAGVTKGALYHHFPDKAALGRAVVDEVIRGFLLERWLTHLGRPGEDPLAAIQATLRLRAAHVTAEEVELGCPLNNLAQEMSPLDERLRRRIEATFEAWREGFERALRLAQENGTLRRDVDPRRVAAFLVAATEGSFGVAKSAGSRAMFRSNLEMLAAFLDTLRPTGAPPGRRGARGARRPRRDPSRAAPGGRRPAGSRPAPGSNPSGGPRGALRGGRGRRSGGAPVRVASPS